MKAFCFAGSLVLSLIVTALSLPAHHTWPVSNEKLVTVKGKVIDFTWANPHPMITLEVQTANGQTEKWLIGGPAITRMEGNGWSKSTLKAGDIITGSGYQFVDGQKIIRLQRVILPDGKEMRVYGR